MKKGVPASAIEAVRKLVENGHEAWLCTGRSRAFVPWYLEQIPFTGMITACGATVRKLVENGHEAWLCTGRSRAFVPWYLEQIPFTGMITACGATIEKDGKRLFNREMTCEEAEFSVKVLRKNGLIPVMEGADFMYYDKDEYRRKAPF